MSWRGTFNVFGIAGLWLAILATAIGCVYARHEARRQFVELRKLEHERDELEIEWNGLRLTEGYLARYDLVEQKARTVLEMDVPEAADIAVIKP